MFSYSVWFMNYRYLRKCIRRTAAQQFTSLRRAGLRGLLLRHNPATNGHTAKKARWHAPFGVSSRDDLPVHRSGCFDPRHGGRRWGEAVHLVHCACKVINQCAVAVYATSSGCDNQAARVRNKSQNMKLVSGWNYLPRLWWWKCYYLFSYLFVYLFYIC